MESMNLWLWAATAFLISAVPSLIVCLTGRVFARFIALQMIQTVAVLVVMLISIGAERSIYMDVALALALTSLGSGLIFARFLERWS